MASQEQLIETNTQERLQDFLEKSNLSLKDRKDVLSLLDELQEHDLGALLDLCEQNPELTEGIIKDYSAGIKAADSAKAAAIQQEAEQLEKVGK